jgi:hypothetical protein
MNAIKSLKTMALAATLTIGGLLAAGSSEALAAGPGRGGPRVGGAFRGTGYYHGPGYGWGYRGAYRGGWWRPSPYHWGYRRLYPYPYPSTFPNPYPYPVPVPGGRSPYGF